MRGNSFGENSFNNDFIMRGSNVITRSSRQNSQSLLSYCTYTESYKSCITLNFLATTSKFHTVSMFVTVGLEIIFMHN
jgi:hypothetical protein